MPWKDPNARRAKRAVRRTEIRANERAWYQQNRDKVLTKRRAKRALDRAQRPAKPTPDPEERRARLLEKGREKGRKQRKNPVYQAKTNARSKAWREVNPDKARTNNKGAKRRAFAEKELLAGRPRPLVCDICGRSDRVIHFDHDHGRGHFRGWICGQDNMALGLVRDDVAVLRKMIAYLERHKDNASAQFALPGI
jgi:predicted Zn-dependent protease